MRFRCGIFLLLMLLSGSLHATERSGDCLDCHSRSGAYRQLQASAHTGFDCRTCHGSDHDRIDQGTARVDAEVCGRCHRQELAQHRASRHGLGLHAGWGCTRAQPERDRRECAFCHRQGDSRPLSAVQCARFLKQSSAMGEIGCNRCHMVENSCASCHGNHLTDQRIVRDPTVCAKCHMGPDHPQWEAWETSRHGALFRSTGPAAGPTCQRCHMPQGTHDVSGGLTAPPSGEPYAAAKFATQRERMLRVCQDCHARGFAERDLGNADAVRTQTLAMVDEARRLIRELDDRSLLDPAPAERPPHPQRGRELVLDGTMLYEDISHIESLYFRLNKFAAAQTFKGAYHQNPAYAHWYGNAGVKLLLSDIRAEARRLKASAGEDNTAVVSDEGGEEELRVLQKQHQRGEISDQEYAERKQRILDRILQ